MMIEPEPFSSEKHTYMFSRPQFISSDLSSGDVPICRLTDGRGYHVSRLQPSMKIHKDTTVTPADAINPNTSSYRRLSVPKAFILHDTNNDKTYKTIPADNNNAYRYIILQYNHNNNQLYYNECKLHKTGFANLSTKEDITADLLEKQNKDREKLIQKHLATRFKSEDLQSLDSAAPVSAYITKADKDDIVLARERLADTEKDHLSNKHIKKSKVDLGFEDEETAMDFNDTFDDDDEDPLAEDEELDEDGGDEAKKLKKILKEESDDEDSVAAKESDNMEDVNEAVDTSDEEKQKAAGKKRSAPSQAENGTQKKQKTSSASGAPVSSSATSSASQSEKVTETDIRLIMMRHGQLTTKQLTQKLGDKLKYLSADEKNTFRSMVQKLCTFKRVGEEKYLVLKDNK